MDYQAVIIEKWGNFAVIGKQYRTPDDGMGRVYTIIKADEQSLTIKTQNGSLLDIHQNAFVEALRVLSQEMEGGGRIGSNNNFRKASALCQLVRTVNRDSGNTISRVINYVLPPLAAVGLVKIDGGSPNKVWLIK